MTSASMTRMPEKSFVLLDSDHENERTCEVVVAPKELRVDLRWSLEVNEDYLGEGDDGPELAQLEKAYGARLPAELKAFVDERASELDRKEALDLADDRIDGKYLGVDHPVLFDLRGESLLANAAAYERPSLCAFGKFVGQGLGMRYFGVTQADARPTKLARRR